MELTGGVWSGPLESSQGLHLVLVTERRESRALPLSQVRNAVREDLLVRRAAAARRELLATLRARHRVPASRR